MIVLLFSKVRMNGKIYNYYNFLLNQEWNYQSSFDKLNIIDKRFVKNTNAG